MAIWPSNRFYNCNSIKKKIDFITFNRSLVRLILSLSGLEVKPMGVYSPRPRNLSCGHTKVTNVCVYACIYVSGLLWGMLFLLFPEILVFLCSRYFCDFFFFPPALTGTFSILWHTSYWRTFFLKRLYSGFSVGNCLYTYVCTCMNIHIYI